MLVRVYHKIGTTSKTYNRCSGIEVTRSKIHSHFRFFAAMWASWGAMTWWSAENIQERKGALKILLGFVALGGAGRAVSAWKYGFSTPFAILATVVEFVAPAGLWVVLP